MKREDPFSRDWFRCFKSLAGCSPCSRRLAAAWAELLRSPAGWWPARSHSSYWPETPSCRGTDVDVTAEEKQTCIFLKDDNVKKHQRQTYLDSSSRSLAPPVNCSFLRCQFISWISFLVPPPQRKDMTVKHAKSVITTFLQGHGLTSIFGFPSELSQSWKPSYWRRKKSRNVKAFSWLLLKRVVTWGPAATYSL